ncbi:MAG: response regulator [Myxococcota bacterium]
MRRSGFSEDDLDVLVLETDSERRERWAVALGDLCTRTAKDFDQLLDLIHDARPDAIVMGWGDQESVERIDELVNSGHTVVAMVADPADGAIRFFDGAYDVLGPDREIELPRIALHCAEVSRALHERDTYRRELRNALRLEAVGRLASTVAHDFNNMLTTVSCFASFIEDMAEDPGIRDDIREVIRAAERGSRLTDRLLSLSHRRAASVTRFGVNDVVEDLQRLMSKTAGAKVHVDVIVGPKLQEVEFDRGDLEHALLNTVIQCRDSFGSRSGTVVVETAFKDEMIVVQIRDDGPGFTAPELKWIFAREMPVGFDEPRVSAVRTVRRTIEHGGGRFSISSIPGDETIYQFIFSPAAEKTAHPYTAPKFDADGRMVMVLEPDERVAIPLRRTLEEMKLTAHVCASVGDLKVALHSGVVPDFLLLDEVTLAGNVVASSAKTILMINADGRTHDHVTVRKPFQRASLVRAFVEADERNDSGSKVAPARVLIVDDDELTARSLMRILDGLCEPELVYGDRSDMLARLDNDDYDLVICDMLMPGMNGMQLFEWVRARNPSRAGRFVFLTAASEFEVIRQFAASVPNPVLAKPVDRRGFESLLSERGLLTVADGA